jgi:lysozyme
MVEGEEKWIWKSSKEELRRDEGLRLNTYFCTTGHRTIGYGHCIDRRPSVSTCSLEDAEKWLDEDIQSSIQIADVFMWPETLHVLTEKRQRALVNLAFNIGFNICKFKKLRQAIRDKDWKRAGEEILDSLYARQVGDRAVRMAELWENGNEGI